MSDSNFDFQKNKRQGYLDLFELKIADESSENKKSERGTLVPIKNLFPPWKKILN
jgi:hypothetical protein